MATSRRQEDDNSDLGDMPNPFKSYNIGNWYGSSDSELDAPRTLRQLDLMSIIARIRKKHNWLTDIRKPSIVKQWRNEMEKDDTLSSRLSSVAKRQAIFDEALAELLQSAETLCRDDIRPSPVGRVFESDERIDDALRGQLIEALRPLENAEPKNWRPDSDEKIVDLVDPSLYSVISGVTLRVVDGDARNWKRFVGSGDPISLGAERFQEADGSWSTIAGKLMADTDLLSDRHQWLPTDIVVDKKGRVAFDSYINNLHPDDHAELYTILARLLERFIPMFAWTLTWHADFTVPVVSKMRKLLSTTTPPATTTKPVNLNNRRLQVIVKLCSVELTPSKPSFDGGFWHIEGLKNEEIVSSGIYYYSSDNISESLLDFRMAVRKPTDNYDPFEMAVRDGDGMYGLHQGEPLNQRLGSVVARQGRCVCFPNTLQHRVAPFRLTDASRAGHRKILVFFLINPKKPIISTSSVPPQQKEWYLRELRAQQSLAALPSIAVDLIHELVDYPLTLDEAKAYRRELIAERRHVREQHSDEGFERPFLVRHRLIGYNGKRHHCNLD